MTQRKKTNDESLYYSSDSREGRKKHLGGIADTGQIRSQTGYEISEKMEEQLRLLPFWMDHTMDPAALYQEKGYERKSKFSR